MKHDKEEKQREQIRDLFAKDQNQFYKIK